MNIIITSGKLIERVGEVEITITDNNLNIGLDLLSNLVKYKIISQNNNKIFDNNINRILSEEDKVFYLHTSSEKEISIKSELVEYMQIDNYEDFKNTIKKIMKSYKIDMFIHLMSISSKGLLKTDKGIEFIERPDVLSDIKKIDKNIFLIGIDTYSGSWLYDNEKAVNKIVNTGYIEIEKKDLDLLIYIDIKEKDTTGIIPTVYFSKGNKQYAYYAYETKIKEDIAQTIVNSILYIKNEPYYIEIPEDFKEEDYYDGTLSGTFKKGNKNYYFYYTNDLLVRYWRIYTVIELNQEEVEIFDYYTNLADRYYNKEETTMEKEKEPGYWKSVRKLLKTEEKNTFILKLHDKNNIVGLAIL